MSLEKNRECSHCHGWPHIDRDSHVKIFTDDGKEHYLHYDFCAEVFYWKHFKNVIRQEIHIIVKHR